MPFSHRGNFLNEVLQDGRRQSCIRFRKFYSKYLQIWHFCYLQLVEMFNAAEIHCQWYNKYCHKKKVWRRKKSLLTFPKIGWDSTVFQPISNVFGGYNAKLKHFFRCNRSWNHINVWSRGQKRRFKLLNNLFRYITKHQFQG